MIHIMRGLKSQRTQSTVVRMRGCRNLRERNERIILEQWSIEEILKVGARYRRYSPDPEGQDRLRDLVEKMFYPNPSAKAIAAMKGGG